MNRVPANWGSRRTAAGIRILSIPLSGVLLLAVVIVFATPQLYGQLKLSGKVFDAETNTILSFASVTIKGKPIGTISNEAGMFDLYLNAIGESDTLLVSMIGYKSFQQLVKDIPEVDCLVISLIPQPVFLREVVINPKDQYARSILLEALANIEKNFPVNPYVYSGFIRELWLQNRRNVSLAEGVFHIQDDGYRRNHRNAAKIREKVDLKNVRATRNYLDPVFRSLAGNYNTLTSALRWNQLKYPHPSIMDNLKTQECTLEQVTLIDGDSLAVVSFVTTSETNKYFERKDIFYIKLKNMAIKKHESREYAREGKYRNIPWALPDSTFLYKAKDVSTVYEFQEYNGKMYLKYFNEKGAADIYNTKTNSSFEVESNVTIAVTEIDPGKVTRKIPHTIDNGKSLILQTTAYDPGFWADNAEVKLVPLTAKQVRDLEWEMPLEKQFAEIKQCVN